MNKELQKIIENELINLPKEIREAISSFDWGTTIEEIVKKYGIGEDKIFELQLETGLALLGMADEYILRENIEKNVKLDAWQADLISQAIIEEIIDPITEKVEENIKKDLKERRTNWIQNLNFILSGGDYFSFLERPGPTNPLDRMPTREIPANISKIEDIKSKFTI